MGAFQTNGIFTHLQDESSILPSSSRIEGAGIYPGNVPQSPIFPAGASICYNPL